MTRLVASVWVEDVARAGRTADEAVAAGADAIELRIDPFDGDPAAVAALLRAFPDRMWIITCRSGEEGGAFRGDTMERVSRILAAARGTGAYVDFEWADWIRSDNIRQKIRLAVDGDDARLILSIHDFSKCPDDLEATVVKALEVSEAVTVKAAYRADDVAQSFDALDLMRKHRERVIAIAMGEDGLWTRVLAGKLGAGATYAAADTASATAPGQLTVEQMRGDYRFAAIGPDTKVYGVIGDPVGHSMSPLIFNRWFARHGVDAIYLPLRVRGAETGLRHFLDGCRQRPWLDIGGFSVTLPHKVAALLWAAQGADSMSRWIGAVNTLTFGSEVRAHNTDCYAAVGAIVDALGCRPAHLSGRSVDVLGAGGAAQAIVYGLYELGCEQTIYARTPAKAEALAESFSCAVRPWEDRDQRTGEIVVNCTSVGMAPNAGESPLPARAWHGCAVAFDMVYNPLTTRFLQDAKSAGARCVSGLEMFVRQAAMQFELWTGLVPDLDAARQWVETAVGVAPDGEEH